MALQWGCAQKTPTLSRGGRVVTAGGCCVAALGADKSLSHPSASVAAAAGGAERVLVWHGCETSQKNPLGSTFVLNKAGMVV